MVTCRFRKCLENEFCFTFGWFDNELNFWCCSEVKFMMICQWRCAVFQGEPLQSSNCKPLWFLTCFSRAYCTWCYLFKAICTDNWPPRPPSYIYICMHIYIYVYICVYMKHSYIFLPFVPETGRWARFNPTKRVRRTRNRPYVELPLCHNGDFIPRHTWSFLQILKEN